LLAPFIHAHFFHIAANSLTLLILLLITLTHNRSVAFGVILMIIIMGGLGTWLFGSSNSVHIGASGVIFGLIGYLLSLGYYQRDFKSAIVSLLVFFLYGGALIFAMIPTIGISWTGHVFGFLAGVYIAKKTKLMEIK
jgi:membrane associated rhomboid family serine protease